MHTRWYGRLVATGTENADLIRRFYEALDAQDGDSMAACYTPDATFRDPVFGELRGSEVGAMWRMLTERSDDLAVDLVEHGSDGDRGWARWIATYTFTQTGRGVTNDVRASMLFRDGLIADHRDDFDLYRWSRQALGPPGLFLGWTPIVRGAVRRRAREGLEEFLARGA
jgi:ketosteroid isomerase-like protein